MVGCGAQVGAEEEKQVLRGIENYTVKKSAWLYKKFNNARGSDFARAVATELDATETMEEELVDIAQAGWQVEFRIFETGYGLVRHGCSIDDVMKGQSK